MSTSIEHDILEHMNPTLEQIPEQHRELWMPFEDNNHVLLHYTPEHCFHQIYQDGYLSPQDSKTVWEGMSAIYLCDPSDPMYKVRLPFILERLLERGSPRIICLYIKTKNQLFRATHKKRTFQIASLDPIPISEILTHQFV